MSPLRDAAVAYAARGWPVFPLGARGKLPLISKANGGRGHLDATVEASVVSDWWTRWPDANVGLACGSAAGFFALDVDPKHGGDESLRSLIAANGPLPTTVTVKTGGGGWHFYFQHVPGLGNTRGDLAEGLDTRGDGQGYVAAPPSVHPDGGSYAWAAGRDPDHTSIEPAPAWLVAALVALKGGGGKVVAAEPDYWRGLWLSGVREGGRNDAATRLAGHLLRRRLDPYMVLDMLKMWNSTRVVPPLPEREIDVIVDSIAGREVKRLEKKRGK